ncbi:hypothetical protein Q5752_003331 [Cryptotrichosporon argae]
MASPPSFATLFKAQQQQHPAPRDSFDYPADAAGPYDAAAGYGGAGELAGEPEPLSERRLSASSSAGLVPAERAHALQLQQRHQQHEPMRQDSFPFDPASTTLIQTAPLHPFSPDPTAHAYADAHAPEDLSALLVQHATYSHQYDAGPWQQPFEQPYVAARAPSPLGSQPMSVPLYGGNPYDAATFAQPQIGREPTGVWGIDFLGQQQQQQQRADASASTSSSRRASFNGAPDDDAVQDELARIIAASVAGTPAGSRTPSPFAEPAATVSASPFGHQQHDSLSSLSASIGARSPSPYGNGNGHVGAGIGQAAVFSPSPPVAAATLRHSRSASSSSSPFHPSNKPQSPPALVIPQHGSSPSPVLAHIITQPQPPPPQAPAAPAEPGRHQTFAASNTLFPPANPALTGMAGISPIAPSADGPMIYIQPSTPISGLRDQRGIFDAALRNAHAAAGHQRAAQANEAANASVVQPTGQAEYPQLGPSSDFLRDAQAWAQSLDLDNLRPSTSNRTRAKSESDTQLPLYADATALPFVPYAGGTASIDYSAVGGGADVGRAWQTTVNAWRQYQTHGAGADAGAGIATLDPRSLPGGQVDGGNAGIEYQMAQLAARRMAPIDTSGAGDDGSGGVFKYAPGQFSPTSLAFYHQLGLDPAQLPTGAGTASAPGQQTAFHGIPQHAFPHSAAPNIATFAALEGRYAPGGLGQGLHAAAMDRRRSIGGEPHPAAGAGTPGYGVEFASHLAKAARGLGGPGHRRAARSEDLGRGGTGWGVGAGGSTASFLASITNPDDGTLLPPAMRDRSRSLSRHSSGSGSNRSPSPALSVSSQGSSMGYVERMDMPEYEGGGGGGSVAGPSGGGGGGGRARVVKQKVTSMATEAASASRRTNSGVFVCPVPGCGSTFTRHFNLKGHLRSHNDERPYKCLYDGCPKATIGFARQHDCKRHMLLHEGLRPFECGGCGKKFARLDALTRHHKSEQGQECAISHPLPTNPDGSPMSESQYKAWQAAHDGALGGGGGGLIGRTYAHARTPSWSGVSEGAASEDDFAGSGMDDYDRA